MLVRSEGCRGDKSRAKCRIQARHWGWIFCKMTAFSFTIPSSRGARPTTTTLGKHGHLLVPFLPGQSGDATCPQPEKHPLGNVWAYSGTRDGFPGTGMGWIPARPGSCFPFPSLDPYRMRVGKGA